MQHFGIRNREQKTRKKELESAIRLNSDFGIKVDFPGKAKKSPNRRHRH